MDRFGQLPAPAVALFELRRLRVLGGARATPRALRVFHERDRDHAAPPAHAQRDPPLVGGVRFQVEFMTGREFGLRVRGEGILLLNRVRELLEVLAAGAGSNGTPA